MFSVTRLFQFFLKGCARLVVGAPLWVLAAALLLTAVSAWLTATQLKVRNSISSVLRDDSPVNKAYLTYKREFGVEEEYVVLIESPDVTKNREVAVEIGEALRSLQPDISRVFYRFDFSRLQPRFLLYLPPEELRGIETEIQGYAAALQKNQLKLEVNSVLDEVNAKFSDTYLRKADNWKEFKPFIGNFVGILNQLADQVEGRVAAPKAADVDAERSQSAQARMAEMDQMLAENEFISFNKGKLLMVLATPGQLDANGISPYSETVKKIRTLLAETGARHPGVKLLLTGEPVLNDDELQTSTRDILKASILTFCLIALLFAVSYREWARPILAMVVLIMSTLWSLGFAVVGVGHLNLMSQAFVVMVLGLGIDFGIQVMGRYEEELGLGRTMREALETALTQTGLSVTMGALTTALAFYTMCFNEFIGLSELGVIAGTGVLLALLANLTVLPALFVLRDRRRAQLMTRKTGGWRGGLRPLLNHLVYSRPRLVLGVAAVITLLTAWKAPHVSFDYNLLNLQNPSLPSVQAVHYLQTTDAKGLIPGIVIADNLEDARAKIAQLKTLPTVKEAHSLTDFFPEQEAEKRQIIQRISRTLSKLNLNTDVSKQVDVAKAKASVDSLLQQSREGLAQAKKYVGIAQQARDAVEVFGGLIPPLERAQKAMSGLTQAELGRRLNRYQVETFGTMQKSLAFLRDQKTDRGIQMEDLPPEMIKRFLSSKGRVLIEVTSTGNIWERQANVDFVNDLRRVDPEATGTPVQNFAYIELIRSSFVEAAVGAFLAILVMVLLYFRSFGAAFLAMLPLAVAMVWTVGLMVLTDLPFNPANIITLPLVIGCGVAYGIYTVDRIRESNSNDLFSNSTGKSILLSGGTTIIGFASLLISDYRGMSSLGYLMSIGITMCLITSIVVLPQVLRKR